MMQITKIKIQSRNMVAHMCNMKQEFKRRNNNFIMIMNKLGGSFIGHKH